MNKNESCTNDINVENNAMVTEKTNGGNFTNDPNMIKSGKNNDIRRLYYTIVGDTIVEDSVYGLGYNTDFDGKIFWEIKGDDNYEMHVDIYDILFALTLNNSLYKENVFHLIAKAIILREIKGVNLLDFSKVLNFMKIDKLNIISVKGYGIGDNINIICYKKPCKINYIEISIENFIAHINKPEFDFTKHNLDTLYILRGGSFIDIKRLFSKINNYEVNITRGGGQRSHFASPLEGRLWGYIYAMFNLDFKYISYLNTYNEMEKHRYLLSQGKPTELTTVQNNTLVRKLVSKPTLFNNINHNNEKSFHTYSRCKEKDSAIFSYLDRIDEIVNNSNSLYEAQEEIEVSWISLMKERLEDPNISSWQALPTLIKKSYNTLEKSEIKGILKKRFRLFSSEVSSNKKEIIILTISVLISNYYRMTLTNIRFKLGNDIAFYLFKQSLSNKEVNINKKFIEWKKERRLDNNDKLCALGDYFILLFITEPTRFFEVEWPDEDFIDTACTEILKVSSEYIETIKDTLFVHPTSLPMISQPLVWDENKYGGFIENQYNHESLITGSSYHGHKLENKESLYKAVNYLNKTEFSVNIELLDYILNEGQFLLDNKNEQEVFQNNITIKVAKIYSKFKFYLNLNCDWRARLYTNSFFLSYQAGDLSKSLIQFAEGEKLTDSGLKYLYICCANAYSSGLSKKSFTYRISWVKRNLPKIISLDKDFIIKAYKKIQFTAFCMALRNYHNDNNYEVKLPVFLDATCSGMQHLAAMLQDINMGTHVNLISKTENDDVGDLYQTVVDPINKAINKLGEENSLFKGLREVMLNRQILKPSIMTQVYAVTTFGIFRQIKSQFRKEKVLDPIEKTKDGKSKYNNWYYVPTKSGKEILLSHIDIYKMAEVISNQIFEIYPPLKQIYNYFINSTKLMLKLKIPIVWFTPAGLEISQFYNKSITKKVQLCSFGKTRTRVYREWKDILDKTKQSQAIIPNIIHSFDASHLINVINSGYSKNICPIISVHDCFGTHPNKMEKLANIIRSEFVLLYIQENFLEKYNARVINSIMDNNYEIIDKDGNKNVAYYETKEDKDGNKYISQRRKLYEIPKPPKMGSLDLKEIYNAINLVS